MTDPGKWRGVVADIERAATARGRANLGYFAIEGARLHERALRSDTRVDRVVVGEGAFRRPDSRMRNLLDDLERAETSIFRVPETAIEKLTEGRSIGAIVGLVPLPEPPALERVLGGAQRGRSVLLVAVDVEDPGNVGALCRTALASGCAGLVAVGISDPYHPRAVRTSMGSLFKLLIVTCPAVEPLVEQLAEMGVETLAAVSQGGLPLQDLPGHSGPRALLVGREAFGLPDGTTESADVKVSIPMAPGVDSFSVNAAAAVLLYELLGRRSATVDR